MFLLIALFLCLSTGLYATEEEQLVQRIHAHLLIHDFTAAQEEARSGLTHYPTSDLLWNSTIIALGRAGDELGMMAAWHEYTKHDPKASENRQLLEEMAWSVLRQGAESASPLMRIMGLIGAFFAQDARSVDVLQRHMQEENAIVRGAAVQLAAEMHDAKLCDAMLVRLRTEKRWEVRLATLNAIGKMKIAEAKPDLVALISAPESIAEEKAAAAQSLVYLIETVERRELEQLARSDRAGLRQLACQIVAHFMLERDLDLIIPLLKDHCSEVRAAALQTLGVLRTQEFQGEQIRTLIAPLIQDRDPQVAINASWVLILADTPEGIQQMRRWLMHDEQEVRIQAVAALGSSGRYGLPLAIELFQSHTDPYVRMNLALLLIGQRVAVDKACHVLYTEFANSKERWMWKEDGYFRALAPNDIKFQDLDHPEEVNQLTHLEVLNIMAMLRYPQTQEAITAFLQQKTWGVTGLAAALLLTEGDEAAVDVVKQLLQHPLQRVRVQAALILALWGRGEEAITVLQDAYADADRELKEHILEGIGRVGATSSIPFLITQLENPYQSLRIIAACALLQCLYH